MKKIKILSFIILFFAVLPAYAFNYYYVARSGDILQVGTNIPIFKRMKMNTVCNTILVKIGMDRYYMVKDDGTGYTRRSLVGCQDYASTNIFDPLVALNSDNVLEKLTSEELRKANIRFVNYRGAFGVLDLEHPQNDLSLDKIGFIDLNNMRFYSNNYAEVHLYLAPKEDNKSVNRRQYMKEVLVEIKSIPFNYADRMTDLKKRYFISR